MTYMDQISLISEHFDAAELAAKTGSHIEERIKDIFVQAEKLANEKGIAFDAAVQSIASITGNILGETYKVRCFPRLDTWIAIDEYSVIEFEFWQKEFREVCQSGLDCLLAGMPIPGSLRKRGKKAAEYLKLYSKRQRGAN